MDEHTLIFPRKNSTIQCRPDGVYVDGRRTSESLEEMLERTFPPGLLCRAWPLQVEANRRASDIFLTASPQWARLDDVALWYWWAGAWLTDLHRGGGE